MKKALIPLFAILLIGLMLTQTQLGTVLRTGNLDTIAAYIQSFGWLAVIISGVVVALQTFFPFIPFFLIAGVNVIVFGAVGGVLVTWLSAVTGACLSFLLARYVAYDWAQARVGQLPFFQKLNAQASRRGFQIILMARLIPVIPSGMINLAAGLSPIRFSAFLLATFIGKLPITLFESVLGHDLLNIRTHTGRFFAMLAVLGLLMWGGSKLAKVEEPQPASSAADDSKEEES